MSDKSYMKRYLPFFIIILVFLTAVGVGVALMRKGGASSSTMTAARNIPPDLATRPLTIGQDAARTNPPGPGAEPSRDRWQTKASITLEEFGDYQCPPCGALHGELDKLAPLYNKRVHMVFRNFPLTNIHENALDAARAAEAAGLQGRFWQMHDQLYNNQTKWAKDSNARQIFTEYARGLGLDVARFTHDIDSLQVNTRIQQDMARGDTLGVKGTPTVFLGDREVALNTAGDLQKALDAALKTAP